MRISVKDITQLRLKLFILKSYEIIRMMKHF